MSYHTIWLFCPVEKGYFLKLTFLLHMFIVTPVSYILDKTETLKCVYYKNFKYQSLLLTLFPFIFQLMDFAEGRIVLVLEGGYNLDSIAKSTHACLEVLLEDKPLMGSSETHPFESTWRVIQAVITRVTDICCFFFLEFLAGCYPFLAC